jgi:hypothetical protein
VVVLIAGCGYDETPPNHTVTLEDGTTVECAYNEVWDHAQEMCVVP